jgi:aminoglycoside phosphotransferase (APT) family kinase protein
MLGPAAKVDWGWRTVRIQSSRVSNDDRAPSAICPDPAWIENSVCSWLAKRLRVAGLHCIEGPTAMPHGWEAHVYRLRLAATRPLPSPFNEPLTVRAYETRRAVPRARHEFAVLSHFQTLGFPVPQPVLLEEDCHLLGGPVLLLRWVGGDTLLDFLRRRFTRIVSVPAQLAELHAALHALPAVDFPVPDGPFLDRRLDELAGMVRAHDLEGLTSGLNWLRSHRPTAEGAPSILHLDFHPVNIVVSDGEPQAVLDWSEADVGDRHADIAMTLVLIATAPISLSTFSERLLARPARWCMARRYRRTYHRQFPLDAARLRYYTAWAALRRLAVCGMWRRSGPRTNGFKATSLRFAGPCHERALRRCFRCATGLSLPALE